MHAHLCVRLLRAEIFFIAKTGPVASSVLTALEKHRKKTLPFKMQA